jgi:hypothetical protein
VTTNSLTVLEIVQATAVVKLANGSPAKGVVVTFSEMGSSLLLISPSSLTALTDENGNASVEIRAKDSSSIGATEVAATATVGETAVTGKKAVAISSAPTSGEVVSPQDLANAVNFLDVNPADRSIVLAGSGGNGRSESATLRFRVVDKNNTPVKGAVVAFSVSPSNDVTLNFTSGLSDSDGVVITTISSKTVATAVVVKATLTHSATATTISTQSDQLLVTTGLSTQGGFDLSASKYNLNAGITGDSSNVTVSIVDANGNRVADGVPVVFTTNFGAVGSSSRGGCLTSNGACTVTYSVQAPRPPDGQFARVTASTQLGSGSVLSGFLDFVVSDVGTANFYSAVSGGAVVDQFTNLAKSCKFSASAFLGTPLGLPVPAGTTITVNPVTSDAAGSVKVGSPVLDLARTRTSVGFEFDLSALTSGAKCDEAGGGTGTANYAIELAAGSRVNTLFVSVAYPK